ncbi:MAG: GyrI-like domain-containing protein, partial [Acidimicrobiia bacterium]
ERLRLRSEVRTRQHALEEIERILGESISRPVVEIRREDLTEAAVVVVPATGPASSLGGTVTRAIVGLRRRLRAQSIRWQPPFGGIFPLDLTEGDVDATVFVRLAAPAPPWDLATEYLPVGPAAVAVHEGSYAQLPCTYEAMFDWIEEASYEPVGPVVEEYLSLGSRRDGNPPRTRLLVPLAS